jgi:hypothetical protein
MRRSLSLVVVVLVATLTVVGTARADVGPLVRFTGPSPFAPGCNGAPQTGTVYTGAEVEPYVSSSPADARNLVAVWQQDRWSNGGSQGNLTAHSSDGGRSWQRPTPPPFSRCAGGNPANGGDYERTSDPWVSIGPDGTAHQIALAIDGTETISAVLVSSSKDGGRTWGAITALQRDTTAALFNDKESITADPTDANLVYAVWDRLQAADPDDPGSAFSGDTLFARSTDGGKTWEPTRTILDFPDDSNVQSLGNQIAVLGDGTLVNVFDLIDRGTPLVAVQRSTDKGLTWSEPIVVDVLFSSAVTAQGGVVDPFDGHPVRTGDLLPAAAPDPRPGSSTVHIVWQDLRFTLLGPIANDQIVLASSTDGGRTWTDPHRVSANKDVQSFTGSVHVDPAGTLGVTYYDFTHDDPSGGPLHTDAWFTASHNGGLTFTPRERLTQAPFDMRAAPDAEGFFVGDYEGLTWADGPFVPVFVLTNAGDVANPTDVLSTAVSPDVAQPGVGAGSRERARARTIQRRLEGAVKAR